MFKKIDGKIDVQENRWRILPGIQMHRKKANRKFETQNTLNENRSSVDGFAIV